MLALSGSAAANLGAFLVLSAAGFALLVFGFAALAFLRARAAKTGLLALAFLVLLAKTSYFAVLYLREYPDESPLLVASAAADLVALVLLYFGILART